MGGAAVGVGGGRRREASAEARRRTRTDVASSASLEEFSTVRTPATRAAFPGSRGRSRRAMLLLASAMTMTMKPVSESTTAPASRRTLLARSGFLLVPAGGRRQPGVADRVPRRPDDRRGRLRPGVPRDPTRTRARGPVDRLHQGEPAHRGLAPRGVLRAAPRRHAAGDPRLRRLPARARRTEPSSIASRSSTRATETCARSFTAPERPGPRPRPAAQIAGILQVLGKLHRGQLLHRDLTPMNVFVCDGQTLKLGDFGIVRHQRDRRGIRAHTLNRLTAPLEILDGAAPMWQARDDVYQVGQLLGMLVKGDARSAHPDEGGPRPRVHRPPEGDRLPVHRRAPKALRERGRADRGAASPAGGAPGRRAPKSRRAFTSPSRASCRSTAARPGARRNARARSSTALPRRARPSSSAASRTRCRPRAARAAASSWRSSASARRASGSRSSTRSVLEARREETLNRPERCPSVRGAPARSAAARRPRARPRPPPCPAAAAGAPRRSVRARGQRDEGEHAGDPGQLREVGRDAAGHGEPRDVTVLRLRNADQGEVTIAKPNAAGNAVTSSM